MCKIGYSLEKIFRIYWFNGWVRFPCQKSGIIRIVESFKIFSLFELIWNSSFKLKWIWTRNLTISFPKANIITPFDLRTTLAWNQSRIDFFYVLPWWNHLPKNINCALRHLSEFKRKKEAENVGIVNICSCFFYYFSYSWPSF